MNSENQPLLEEVQRLRLRVEQLESQRRRRVRSTVVFLAVALVSVTAWGQLVTFNPDEPARADQVNSNFAQLRNWLEQKVGPVGTSTITLGTPLAGSQVADNTVSGTKVQDNTIASADLTDNTVASVDIADGTIGNADLDPDLSCPTNARQTLGQCIFFRPATGNAYIYTYRNAAATCRAERARLCTVGELSAAHASGFDNCARGWLGDRVNSGTAYNGYPIQVGGPGCGEGINLGTDAVGAAWGAYCCK
ncbi:MAG: hypothetical protein Q8L14_39380 [Myxococcales bacterium]|nr:hypothetical protein [Myxococcales bacterium]